MSLSRVGKVLAPLALLPVVLGCADVNYKERSAVSQTRYATVENFGSEDITAEQVDSLLEEVAQILDVTMIPSAPKVRIMVMPSTRIADLYRQIMTVTPHGADARALYLPGVNVVAVPRYSRAILGHELAHYVTEHYLPFIPRSRWERVALMVEDALPPTPRIVARSPGADTVALRPVIAPLTPAN
jgi:hypothetical protein